MKKLSIALGLAAASLLSVSGNAMAQGYVSGNFGLSRFDADCDEACDKSDLSFSLLGGYKFNKNVAVEGGYISLGKVKFDSGGSIKSNGFLVGAAFSLPMNSQVDLTGRLGLGLLDTKGFGDSEDRTYPYFGVGAGYNLDKNLRLETGVNVYNVKWGDDYNVFTFTAGARYSF